jgi:alginate O-acetyltransferase complex protein AlgI
MVFSSPIFLFLFLPVTLGLYFLLRSRLRNAWLLGMSLAFYGWGEPKFQEFVERVVMCTDLRTY